MDAKLVKLNNFLYISIQVHCLYSPRDCWYSIMPILHILRTFKISLKSSWSQSKKFQIHCNNELLNFFFLVQVIFIVWSIEGEFRVHLIIEKRLKNLFCFSIIKFKGQGVYSQNFLRKFVRFLRYDDIDMENVVFLRHNFYRIGMMTLINLENVCEEDFL